VTSHVLWDVLGPNFYCQIRLYKTGSALKNTGSTFLLPYDKINTRVGIVSFVLLHNGRFFLFNTFFTTVHCWVLTPDVSPGKVGYGCTQQMIWWHPYSHLIHWIIYCYSCYALFHNCISFLAFSKKLRMSIFFEDEQFAAKTFKTYKMITA